MQWLYEEENYHSNRKRETIVLGHFFLQLLRVLDSQFICYHENDYTKAMEDPECVRN